MGCVAVECMRCGVELCGVLSCVRSVPSVVLLCCVCMCVVCCMYVCVACCVLYMRA